METPSLVQQVTQGGPVMVPFLLLFAIWLASLVCELLKKPICKSAAYYHFIFPLGFLILAVIRIVAAFHLHFLTMSQVGQIDPMQYAQSGLIFTRSATIIIGAAVLALLTSLVFTRIRLGRA